MKKCFYAWCFYAWFQYTENKTEFFGTTWPTSKGARRKNNGLKKTKLQQNVSYKEQIYNLTNMFQPVAVIKVIEKWIADRIVNTINTWVEKNES